MARTSAGSSAGVRHRAGGRITCCPTGCPGREIFRKRDGKFAEVWHQEDAPGMLRQLGLEPPQAIMRLATRRNARRYRRELAIAG